MSKQISNKSILPSQKENGLPADSAAPKLSTGSKLPSLNRVASQPGSQPCSRPGSKELVNNSSIKNLEPVVGSLVGERLPSLKQASEKKLSVQVLRGKTDEELQRLIDSFYEQIRDNFDIQEIEEVCEEAENQASTLTEGAKKGGVRQRVVRKVRRLVPKPKPFCPKSPFQMQGLILEKMREYNGLTDENLIDFLTKPARLETFVRNGLITEEGFIVARPNDYLVKKDTYDKVANLDEKPIKVTGKLTDKLLKSPYYNTSYQDYKGMLFKATHLHERLVPVPPKRVQPHGKLSLMEIAIAKQHKSGKPSGVRKAGQTAGVGKAGEEQPEVVEILHPGVSAEEVRVTESNANPIDPNEGEDFQSDFGDAEEQPEKIPTEPANEEPEVPVQEAEGDPSQPQDEAGAHAVQEQPTDPAPEELPESLAGNPDPFPAQDLPEANTPDDLPQPEDTPESDQVVEAS